jgi:hypothetical protein
LDSLNDAAWNLQAAAVQKDQPLHYKVELGLQSAAGQIEKITVFESREPVLRLVYPADARYSRRFGTQEQLLLGLLAYLKAIPMQGKTPVQTLLYFGCVCQA